MTVKLLSWNIWGGKFLPGVTDFLTASNADIIALQEVEEQDDGNNTAQFIAGKLGYTHAYARSMRYNNEGKDVYRGNAVLSKYPIIDHTIHVLSRDQSRTAVQADIDVGGSVLHVISVHIVHSHQQPSPLQVEQVTNLIHAAPKERTVIMGDFNAVPESEAIRIMRTSFADPDTSDTPSWCLYPDGCSVCKPERVEWKLDYVFTTADIAAKDFRAETSEASDHLPISVVVG
ncbi:endonuclease/exonuclease/phosphatase family protein [Patescibacteria group bacterium]|nr:endonuclease/exonuclease/phosphatase family protein [Patescibacteria group bacterium]